MAKSVGRSVGEAIVLYIFLMTGECAQCDWMLAFERTGCPNPTWVCGGTLVPRINLLQGVCEYLKTMKDVHHYEEKAGPWAPVEEGRW